MRIFTKLIKRVMMAIILKYSGLKLSRSISDFTVDVLHTPRDLNIFKSTAEVSRDFYRM